MKRFGTALNCIDGRTQLPVIDWMSVNLDLDYIDLITEPGMDKILSSANTAEIRRIREKTILSLDAHGSAVIAVAGHYDCAANPVDPEKHISDIRKSMLAVASWGLGVEIIGLWVDEFWRVHEIGI